ncbi:MAG TPA: phosphotransferase [Rhizomicrobium sp.]|nr:phosphotransferase [Rhizomicrobium sp.]
MIAMTEKVDFTNAEANRLLSRMGIPADKITRIKHAHRNNVFLCGDEFVLRVATKHGAEALLCREVALLRQLRGRLPMPEVVASGIFEGHSYQLQRRISGEPLLFAWRDATDAAKDVSVRRLLNWLDLMHCDRYAQFGCVTKSGTGFESWSSYYSSQIGALIRQLPAAAKATLDQPLLDEIATFACTRAAVLDDGRQPTLVHNDLWPGNVMACDGFATALLDFELAIAGAADLDLFKLEYFCRQPDAFGCPGDYGDLWDRVLRSRSDLFTAPNLHRRFDVYDLRYALATWVHEPDSSQQGLAALRARLELIVGGSACRRL